MNKHFVLISLLVLFNFQGNADVEIPSQHKRIFVSKTGNSPTLIPPLYQPGIDNIANQISSVLRIITSHRV